MDGSNNKAYLQEFFNKTQKNRETIDDYSATLKKAFNKAFKSSASEDANKALLGRFRTGIIPEIQSIMCTTEPKNFEEAVELADRYNDNKTNAEDPRKSREANMEEFSNRQNRSKSYYSNRKYNQSRSSRRETLLTIPMRTIFKLKSTGSPWGHPVRYHSSTNTHNDITATYRSRKNNDKLTIATSNQEQVGLSNRQRANLKRGCKRKN
ncbi:hypothetical protein BpHYR1_052700 [Brachionus plicatilis]|uniref:Retrotransposon gag domain-containing protein n=1 Tax=Brachionus plicatilis TaxID=10195 RepID=A0A3M7SJU8_BRAPC|nr:hypothetical protein BpHYR1_052700 [Brachionus plicatilis]